MRLLPAPSRPIVPSPVAVEQGTEPRAPSILLTPDGWLVGDLVDIEGRVIDALAGRERIGLMTCDGYRELDRDDVLALVPPAHASRPELRIAKRRTPVTVDLEGLASVTGICHLLPGATVWDVWQRSNSGFAALTEAVVELPDGTRETADLVLVSRHAAATGLRTD